MSKQFIFSKVAVDEIEAAFNAPGGDAAYLGAVPFATTFKTLESPIDAPQQLSSRVNPNSDVETAIALFEAYPGLNPLEASSRGFWTYLTHVDLWDYMRKRFSLSADMDVAARRNKIKDKWFLGEPSQGNLMRHPLAGLWWGVKLSVDESRGSGRYDLTRILFRDLDFLTRTLGTYQLGRLPAAVRGILGYMFNHQEDFKGQFEDKTRYIMKHFNSLGGALHLGCLDENFYADELDRTRDEWLNPNNKIAPKAQPAAAETQSSSQS